MIDRPLRPLFPDGWTRDTQIVAMPLSVDEVNPYDILAMNGASAALMISDVPYVTPIGAVRVGLIEGNFVVNPDEDSLLPDGESELDLVVAGTSEAILMVEAGANEVTEQQMLDALDIAHTEIKKICARPGRAAHSRRQGKDRRLRAGSSRPGRRTRPSRQHSPRR